VSIGCRLPNPDVTPKTRGKVRRARKNGTVDER
jgi:hypothetical protein